VANLDDTRLVSNDLGGDGRLFFKSLGFSAAENELTKSVLIFVELFELGKLSVYRSKNITKRKTKINKLLQNKTTKQKH